MDGTLWTMYSNGNSDSGSGESQAESRKAFAARWRRANAACGDAMPVSILQIPNASKKVKVIIFFKFYYLSSNIKLMDK